MRRIDQTRQGIQVYSSRGDFLCKRVIVSVPTPLYKEIAFDPPLPREKIELAQQNKLGYTNKVLIRYAMPWWRDHGLCGLLQSFTGPISVTRDSSVDERGQFSLTCFSVGKLGRELSTLSQADRFRTVVETISKTVGSGASVPDPIGIEEHEWAKDQWAQGCPCPAAPPGVMSQYEHGLRVPHGKIHFIGTETAHEWKGYMDGAIRSGKRGAQEAMKALESAKL